MIDSHFANESFSTLCVFYLESLINNVDFDHPLIIIVFKKYIFSFIKPFAFFKYYEVSIINPPDCFGFKD